MFKGVFTALITPFKDSQVDEEAFAKLVEWQISEGVHGLVPCGTTGESPTLTYQEHKRVTELCVEVARHRVPVIAGCGSNSTAEAIDFVRHAQTAEAEAVLVVSPYYNKPTQEGLYQHFKEVANATELPLIIYDIPPRSVVKVEDATLKRLTKAASNIVGIKDATCDLARPQVLREMLGGDDFRQFSGEDGTSLAHLAEGGCGVISVVSNIAPRLCAELQEAWWAGNIHKAQTINAKLCQLNRVLFAEANPAPVKYAASLLKMCGSDLRLPLVPVSKETENLVAKAVKKASLKGYG